MTARKMLVFNLLLAVLAVGGVGLSRDVRAQNFDPGGSQGGGGFNNFVDDPLNRVTVTVRVEPVGRFCVRVIEAVGYDPRLNRMLYRTAIGGDVVVSLGVTAYENAFASARTQGDAATALAAGRRDASSFRRGRESCG